MNNKIIYLSSILFLSILIMPKAWSFIPNYQYAYNLTVPSWNYTATSAGQPFNEKAGYVLVKLFNVIDIADINIQGWELNGQWDGAIPFYNIAQNGNTVILLIQNKTNQSKEWHTASIYYDPTTRINPLNSTFRSDLQVCGRTLLKNVGCSYTFINGLGGTNIVSYIMPAPIFDSVSTKFINQFNNQFFSYSPLANLSGILSVPSIVILANRSLNSTKFNISFSPDNSHLTRIQNTNNQYNLSTLGGIFTKPFVLGISQVSTNPNTIFNSITQYDGIGTEYYLSTKSFNSVIGENTVSNTTYIYNSIASKGLHQNLFSAGGYLNISSNVIYNSITYFILPAFTTNYLISNIIPNNNVANSFNINCFITMQGIQNPCSFTYKTQIFINWSYNFTTYAYPTNYITNNIITNTLIFGKNDVSYAILNISHPNNIFNFGSNCDHIYLADYNYSTHISYGAIPFWPLNCTNDRSILLIGNITISTPDSAGGYIFNSFYIYSDSINPLSNQFNSILFNKWQIKGNNIIGDSANTPFIVLLDQPLNLPSNIIIDPYVRVYYDNVYHIKNEPFSDCYSPPLINILDTHLTTLFLFAHIKTILSGGINTQYIWEMFSKYLSTQTIQNAMYLINTSNILYSACTTPPTHQSAVMALYGFNATIRKLYATCNTHRSSINPNGCIGNTTYVTNYSNIFNTTGALNLTLPPPPSSISHLNFTNTTTINFNSLSANTPILDTGIAFPFYVLVVASLFLVFIGLMLLASNSHGHLGFIFILIAIWLFGIWEYQVLYLGMIITIFFIIYEYIEKRRK